MKQYKTRLARTAMTLLIALLTTTMAWAEETLTVYDGTNTSNTIPVYGLYADYGTRSQFVLPATDLTSLKGASIEKLTFYSSSSNASADWGDSKFKVYMKEVDYTSFDATTFEDWNTMTEVFSGSLTVSDNKMVITFDTPYTYEGDNLLIGLHETEFGDDNSISWYGVNQQSNTALYNNASLSHGWSSTFTAQKFLPKTTFTYTPGSGTFYNKPTNLTVSELTANGAAITWTAPEGSPTGYAYQYKKVSDSDWSAEATMPATSTSVSISGLAPATAYIFRVKAVYGTEGQSGYASKNFTTECAVYDIPYTYGFEEAAPFDCWKAISGTLSIQSGTTNSGSCRLDFRGTTSNMIALPQFNAPTNTLLVEFYTRPESIGGSSGKFAIGYMTDITDASTFVAVKTYNSTEMTTTYVKKTVYLVDAPADAIIAMRQFDCSSSYYWFVDDVTVKTIPSCLAPTALGAGNITTTSAKLSWTSDANAWTLYYKKSTDDTYTEVPNVTANSYTLNGLDPSCYYQFYVVANCSATDSSEPSEVFTFITDCDVIAASGYSENFDGITVSSEYTPSSRTLPGCWRYINECTYSYYKNYPTIYYYSSTNFANSTPNCLSFNSYYSRSGSYTPQPQYAILPPMIGLAGMQVKLKARGYNTSSTFKIGTMSDPTDASTFTMIAEQTLTTSYPEDPFEYIIPANCNDSYLAIMIDAATSSRITNSVYIDDIVICEAPACIKPIGLAVTANSITGDGATITWTARGSETSWKIEYATDADFTSPSYATVNDAPTYTFHGLDESTTYYVHVQADCGNIDGSSEYSKTVSFTTTQTPVNLPYSNGFETANDWRFVNGDLTNAWAYGTATNNGEGTHALYVSNDGGSTNAYTYNSSTMVYATKMFNFEAGTYVFSFDWKAYGESTYDYLRVALVPSSVTLTAGTSAPSNFSSSALPTGWIALDGGTKLSQKSDWQSFESGEINIATAGTYMMVFAWRNDQNGGSNPPAAIDNVSIEVITCKTPTGLTAPQSGITATSAQLSWTETGQANAWQIELTDAENNTEIIDADSNPFTLTSLTSETVYSARVRANCGDGYSKWSEEVIFETVSECQTPDGLDATATTISAVISWNGYGIETFNLRYTTDGESWTTKTNVTNPYTLTGLDVATAYTVQVQPTCAGEDTWSTSFVFSTQCVAITTFPWSEGFEVGAFSSCWSQDGKGTWTVGTGDFDSSTGAHNGTYNAKIKHGTSDNITKLMTPVFDLSSLTCPVLSFWYINRKWQSDIDKFAVYYRTAPDAEWIQIDATEEAHEEWTKAEYLLPNPSATYQIAFEMTDGYGYGVGIDDVTIEGALGLADAGSDNSADIEDYDRETVNVVLSGRTLWQDGYWNTLCLPFSLDEDELDASQLSDADIRTLDNAEFNNGTLTLNFTEEGDITAITAGTPYIIKWASGTNITDPVFTGVTIDATTHNVECDLGDGKSITFLGTYDYMSFTSEDRSILFLGDNNTLYWPLSGATIGACRAYFKLKGLSASEVSTTRLFFGGEDETTGIVSTTDFTDRTDATWFTIDGKKLDKAPTRKGLYIRNGHKVVIK